MNLAGIRVLFALEERLGMRILEQLYSEEPHTDTDSTTSTEPGSVPAHEPV